MMLKGNQRGGGRQMALHLLNSEENEHVIVHEVSGFVSDDVRGALAEAYALSQATKCKQYMYSLSLSPPIGAEADINKIEDAIDRAEKKLGLTGQPRVVVRHGKEGPGGYREHAHVVWSRIKADEMKAVNMSHDHDKLHNLSKQLYIEHNWKLPEGFVDKSRKSPLNYTREEWQQAQRHKQNPQEIRADLQECWGVSDSKKAFEHALQDKGYFLARGDRRGFVVLDSYGEIRSLPRQLNKTAKDLKPRLGDAKDLPSIQEVQEKISQRLTQNFKTYRDDLKQKHQQQLAPLKTEKQAMVAQHKSERTEQNAALALRQQKEDLERSKRLRKGFKGLWDKLTGSYQRTVRRNETETQKHALRDKQEREKLINQQRQRRQELFQHFKQLREQHHSERLAFYKNINRHYEKLERQQDLRALLDQERQGRTHQHKHGHDPNHEPEI